MKKTCGGCRALDGHSYDNQYKCELGFEIRNELKRDGFPKPLEECPKPKTIKELGIEEEKYRNRFNQ
ncbi:hypothetical protein [Exiguobacterium sp. S22-S28]|uniref:hypothetical protein n=1 Tax=Exiguobacterium sp. S22-S28 TaxID=3342768 RepID=UPI00372D016F